MILKFLSNFLNFCCSVCFDFQGFAPNTALKFPAFVAFLHMTAPNFRTGIIFGFLNCVNFKYLLVL